MSSYKYLEADSRPPLSVEEVMLALVNCAGVVTDAAKMLDRPRWVVQKLIDTTPTLQQYMGDEQEELVDMAQGVIKKAVMEGDLQASRLVVTTLGKNRGWNQRQEVSGPGGGAVIVQIDGNDADL